MRHALLMVDHMIQEIKPNHAAAFIDSGHLISAGIMSAEGSYLARIDLIEWGHAVFHSVNKVHSKADGGVTL